MLSVEDANEDLFIPAYPTSLAARVASEAYELPKVCSEADINEGYERVKRMRILEADIEYEKRMNKPHGRGRWSYAMRNRLIDLGRCSYCGYGGHKQWDCPIADEDGAPICDVCGKRNHEASACRFKESRPLKKW